MKIKNALVIISLFITCIGYAQQIPSQHVLGTAELGSFLKKRSNRIIQG